MASSLAPNGQGPSPCGACPRTAECFLLPIRSQDETVEAAFGPPLRLRPGEILFSGGTAFDRLYAVREGVLASWQQTEGLPASVVGFYLPGEVAGLGGFAHGHYRFTVTAVQPATVCPVEWSALEKIERLEITRPLQQALARQAELDGGQHRYLMRPELGERIDGCLAALRQRWERVAPPGEAVPIGVELLASHLGVGVEEVRQWTERRPQALG